MERSEPSSSESSVESSPGSMASLTGPPGSLPAGNPFNVASPADSTTISSSSSLPSQPAAASNSSPLDSGQRSSVIIAPSRLGTSWSSGPSSPSQSSGEANVSSPPPPTLTCNSSAMPSSTSCPASGSKIKLRPSVLKVTSGDANDSDDGSSKRESVSVSTSSDMKIFKFAPLTSSSSFSHAAQRPVTTLAADSTVVSSSSSKSSSCSKSSSSSSSSNLTHKTADAAAAATVTNNVNGGSECNERPTCSADPVTSSTPATANDVDSSGGHIFGQNLVHRVLLSYKDAAAGVDINVTKHSGDGDMNDEEDSNTADGKSESNFLATETHNSNSASPNLPEKRKYEAITGEEDESNVLQIYSKLFKWEPTTSIWKEKGKGVLRLNDKMRDDRLCSRLVMRTTGSLIVILNSTLIPGMKFEMSSDRCLRFTNVDGIYLIKGKEKDMEQLNSAISNRFKELAKRIKSEPEFGPDSNADSNSVNDDMMTSSSNSKSSSPVKTSMTMTSATTTNEVD